MFLCVGVRHREGGFCFLFRRDPCKVGLVNDSAFNMVLYLCHSGKLHACAKISSESALLWTDPVFNCAKLLIPFSVSTEITLIGFSIWPPNPSNQSLPA